MEQPAARDIAHEARRGGRDARAARCTRRHNRASRPRPCPASVNSGSSRSPKTSVAGRRLGAVLDLVEEGERMVERLRSQAPGVRQSPARAARARFAQPADLGAQLVDHRDQARGVQRVIGQHAGRTGALERQQGLEDQRVAVARAGRGGGLDHRIFAAHLVGEGRHPERVLHPRDDVEIGQARLDHHEVGALGEVELDLAQRLLDVGRVHLVAALVALEPPERCRPPRGTGRRRPRHIWRHRP